MPVFRLHFMDDPSRTELFDGEESEVVAAILAAHPGRSMELWRRSVLVRVFGRSAETGFLAQRGSARLQPNPPTPPTIVSR
jgi:hypothetical protein